MNPIKDLVKKIWNFGEPKHSHLLDDVGWHSITGSSLDYYHRNDYENAYPSIRVISQKFAAIEPYTVDKSGNSTASNVLDRLYTPNNQMSAYDFRSALAIMALVHKKVYIRVHYRTTRVNAETITGFTFLEGLSEHVIDGKLQFWLPNGEKLTDGEVATLKDINPYNLNDGFSPAFAARRWTSLDDLIADYQSGFFHNGGVPSGQFIITAKTATEYKDIVQGIKENHQGVGRSGGLMFAHRPVAIDGKPLDSQIEWVPFSSSNKDMALKDLFEQANKKIDSVYGVPSSLRGVNDNNTYASVRVDQQIFIENTLEPFTLKVWQKFTHELNRITGGMGVAITFDLDSPIIADEEKVKAEAKEVDARTLTSLTDAGYTLESAIAYIEGGEVKVLKQLEKPQEKPEVLDRDEAKDTPDQPVDISQTTVKAFEPGDLERYESRVEGIMRDALNRQTAAATELVGSKAVTPDNPVDDEEDDRLYGELSAVLLAALTFQGPKEHRDNIRLVLEAGIRTDNISPFILTPVQRAAYEGLLQKVARDINATTATKIRGVLELGREMGLSAQEIRSNIKGLVEDWRIKQIARTEVNRAGNEASLYSMESIAQETGATVNKVWAHSGGDAPCEFCSSLVGKRTPLNDSFVPLGGTVNGTDGGQYVNNFTELSIGGLHPNCHCRQTYEVAA